MRRKLQATSQNKQSKLVSQQETEFNERVNQQVSLRLEVKEKEIARKYKLHSMKER